MVKHLRFFSQVINGQAFKKSSSRLLAKTPKGFEIVKSSEFGRGLISKKEIKFGEILFSEEPLFSYSLHDEVNQTKELQVIETIMESLDLDVIENIMELHCNDEYKDFPLAGRFRTNTFPGRMYSVGAMINHSCFPNVAVSWEDEFIATRDIQAGEELFARYNTGEKLKKEICSESPDCLCHIGSKDLPINQEFRIQGYLYNFLVMQFEKTANVDISDDIQLCCSEDTREIYDSCSSHAKFLFYHHFKKEIPDSIFHDFLYLKETEEWFESIFTKYVQLMEDSIEKKYGSLPTDPNLA